MNHEAQWIEITQLLSKQALRGNPLRKAASSFGNWIASQQFIIAPVPREAVVRGVNKADEPIVRTSKSLNIPLLTDDVGVIDQYRSQKGLAFQPWSVVRTRKGASLDSIARVWRFDWRELAVFARFSVNHSSDISCRGFAFDMHSGLSLTFDGTAKPSWALTINHQKFAVPAAFSPTTTIAIGITGKIVGKKLRIRFMRQDDQGYSTQSYDVETPPTAPSGPVSIGHNAQGQSHLNGRYHDLIICPRTLSPRRFRHLAKWTDLTPAFEDDNVLSNQPVQRFIVN